MSTVSSGARGVEDLLREGGFTPFHRMVVIVTGMAWTFVAMEILLIAFSLPVFAGLWELSGLGLGLIGSASLIGSFLGSVTFGRIADRAGRRPIFMASVLWYCVFTALTASAWNPESLFAFRLLAGLGLGGMLVVDPLLLSEFLPPQNRGRYMVFLDFFWPIGFMAALGMSYLFLDQMDGAWRVMFLVAAFPAFLAFIVRITIPETPFYLVRAGQMKEAAAVLTRVTGSSVTPEMIAEERGPARAPVGDLFRGKLLRSTIITLVAWSALNFSYYGLFIWLPQVLPEVGNFQVENIYALLLLSALAQIPGYLVALWLVEAWGRKRTLASFLVLGGLSGLVFATTESYASFVGALLLVSFFNLGAWGAVYPYTVELFPTVLRGTAFGFAAEGVGKLTAIMGPLVFGFLRDATEGVLVPLAVVALVMTAGGAVVAVFGHETKGKPLE